MATYVVCYDLNRPGQNYTGLLAKLKTYSNWWHHLDSTWLIVTASTASEVRAQLLPLIDANDKLLVIQVDGRAWAANAAFTDEALRWLKANVAA